MLYAHSLLDKEGQHKQSFVTMLEKVNVVTKLDALGEKVATIGDIIAGEIMENIFKFLMSEWMNDIVNYLIHYN